MSVSAKRPMGLGDPIGRAARVTAAIIRRTGRFFLVQRPPEKSFGLFWEFPGGKVEPGESLEESLQREIREELCWDIDVERPFHTVACRVGDLHIELYAYWCRIRGGDLFLREHLSFYWAYPEEFRHFLFTRADQELAEVLATGSRGSLGPKMPSRR
ncbi:MAG TPA: (deoxy)nucleoside triphosphate pyrophosphohydrolase [Syntrophobacteraceae bacterium]|nr:(deoxy)nucleoside triphosphate pyrophosphohydrolase [Syntrophobacteraceae bacterium]